MLSRRDYRTFDFLFYGSEMKILDYQVRPASQPSLWTVVRYGTAQVETASSPK